MPVKTGIYTPNKYRDADRFYNEAKHNHKAIKIIAFNDKLNNYDNYKNKYFKVLHELRSIKETDFVKKNGELKDALNKEKHESPSDFDLNYKW